MQITHGNTTDSNKTCSDKPPPARSFRDGTPI